MKGKTDMTIINARAAIKRAELGHGFNKGMTLKNTTKMKVAQQLRGTKVKATSADGDVKVFPTLLDTAKWVQAIIGNSKIGAAHISHYIKSGKIIDGIGYKFEEITVDEYNKLAS